MWDLIVSVPDHCLSFNFPKTRIDNSKIVLRVLRIPIMRNSIGIP